MLDCAVLFVVGGGTLYVKVVTNIVYGISLAFFLIPVKGLQNVPLILR